MEKWSQHPVIHNPLWSQYFIEESIQIKKILGENILNIHQIGSTAIPGLLAKPIIDMLGEAKDIHKISHFKDAMFELGFVFQGEYGISERAYFNRKNGIAIHLHIFPQNHFQIEKHLLLRDYLLENIEATKTYQLKKEELLNTFPHDRQAYQNGKNDLVQELTKAAYKWKGKKIPENIWPTSG